MKFLTKQEASDLAAQFLDANGKLVLTRDDWTARTESFEAAPGYTYFARAQELVEALGPFQWALLWVVEWEVWPSNENLHLYYRLRESYGDHSHLANRPAVLALKHESEDLVTFVHLGMLFGWGMNLVTSHDYGRVFVSHDGYFVAAPSRTTAAPSSSSSATT